MKCIISYKNVYTRKQNRNKYKNKQIAFFYNTIIKRMNTYFWKAKLSKG